MSFKIQNIAIECSRSLFLEVYYGTLLMFMLQSFVTSIYVNISIETGLVTHFSGYKD